MKVTFTHPAPDGERFAPGCFGAAVGAEWMLTLVAPGSPAAHGVLAKAAVLPGGRTAELTVEIRDDSPAAVAISEAGGGSTGPFSIGEDGTVYRPVEVRRRDPAEAAERIRAGYRDAGIPEDVAQAMIEETLRGDG
jgi:hypothetical protein